MTRITYEIVEHDGGWAYKVGDVFSEPFPSHDAARRAAERAAHEDDSSAFELPTVQSVGERNEHRVWSFPRNSFLLPYPEESRETNSRRPSHLNAEQLAQMRRSLAAVDCRNRRLAPGCC